MPATVDGLKNSSLAAVGNAIHTSTDATSPAHTDSKGNPVTWTGLGHPIDTVNHIRAESSISTTQMSNAVSAAQGVFLATYGQAIYDQATQKQEP